MSEAPRIVILHNAYGVRGGEDSCVANEYEALRGFGWHVERYGDERVLHPRWKAVQAIVGQGDERVFERYLETRRPALLHAHNLFPRYSPKLFAVARRRGIKTVMTLHNFRPLCLNGLYLTPSNEVCERCTTHDYTPGIVRGCYRQSRLQSTAMALHLRLAAINDWYGNIDCFIAPSGFIKSRYVAQGFPVERIMVQGHFMPVFPESTPVRPLSYVLYLGRLSEEKGLRWLLKQFERSDAPCRLLIAGEGPLEPLVHKSLGPTIEYVGYVRGETKDRYLREAISLVMPSECYENFPLAIAEANAWGVPALVSDLGGLAEIVRSGENGTAFTPHSAGDFQCALQRIIESGTSLTYRKRCQDYARRHYDKETFLNRRIALYNALL